MSGKSWGFGSAIGIRVAGWMILVTMLDSLSLSTLFSRREFITPITDSKRIFEALYLDSTGISPYKGDSLHQPPLLLLLFYPLFKIKHSFLILQFCILLLDILIAWLLYQSTLLLIQREDHDRKTKPSFCTIGRNSLSGKENWLPGLVASLYLFNPFGIASSLSCSTIIFNNVAIVAAAYFSLNGNAVYSIFSVAIASYLSIYPLTLLFPVAVLTKRNIFFTFGLFFLFLGGLFGASFILMGSWDFVKDSYWTILTVEDLTPNIGLFWYFFTEVFKHFRSFYLFAYQFHSFIYCIPLYLRLKHHPFLMFWINVAIITTFKSYPSYGDLSIQIALIPLISHKFSSTRYGYMGGIVALFVMTLAPIFWWMWIYSGTGNANFYYAINLVFTFAQVLFITDVASVVLKDDHLSKKKLKKIEK